MAATATIANWRKNRRKLEGGIQLDAATYKKIATEAAQIGSAERIETERWWKDQFDAVKVELGETRNELAVERDWRRKTTRRLRAHQPWDHQILQQCPDVDPPPPLLDEDEDEA